MKVLSTKNEISLNGSKFQDNHTDQYTTFQLSRLNFIDRTMSMMHLPTELIGKGYIAY